MLVRFKKGIFIAFKDKPFFFFHHIYQKIASIQQKRCNTSLKRECSCCTLELSSFEMVFDSHISCIVFRSSPSAKIAQQTVSKTQK